MATLTPKKNEKALAEARQKGCDEIESKCELTDRNVCLNIVKYVEKGEPLGRGEEEHFLQNKKRWFAKEGKADYSWCVERSFGGGKSGAFVWQIKMKGKSKKADFKEWGEDDFKFGKNRLPAYAEQDKEGTLAIMKVYIDAFRPPAEKKKGGEDKVANYVVNSTRPFREVYAQCLMSGRQGYNCLLDVFTVDWKTLSDELFQSIKKRDNRYGKKKYQLKDRKFYKDFEETEKEYFRTLEKDHQVLVMVTTNSCGDSLLNTKINTMPPSMLLGAWLELFSVWQWSTRRMGQEYTHWDLHPDNIFVDLEKEVRPKVQLDLDFIKNFLKGPTLPIYYSIVGVHSGEEREFLGQVYNVLWGSKMNEILSKFAHLKTLAHDEVLKQFNKLETELTVQFLKKFDDLNKKAFQPCEEFDSVEKSEDPEGWWCPEDRCVRTDADDKKVCGAKQNEDKFIQFESVFSRKTTSRIRESFRATIISLIHNVFSKIKSLLHMKSYFTIEYPRIQLIDFDLVTNKRFEFLEPEQKNKLNSSVLITERAIAWLMKWVPVELALGWIALLPKILPKKIKGEINFQRGDHAHLLTYGLVFATWWLARRDCGPPSLPETDSSIAKCPLSALDMVSSAKTVINFFRELPFDKLQTFLSNPIELIPELISSNVLEQPITAILSKTKSNMKRLVTGSALELAGDKLKIPGMTEIADLFMGGDGNSLLSGKVFRTAIDNKFKIMESYSLEERQEYISYDNTILTIKSESEKTRLYYLFGVAPPLEGKITRTAFDWIFRDYLDGLIQGPLTSEKRIRADLIFPPLVNLVENIGIVLELPKDFDIDIELPKMDLSLKGPIVISMPFRKSITGISDEAFNEIIKGAEATFDGTTHHASSSAGYDYLVKLYGEIAKLWKVRFPFEPLFSNASKTKLLINENRSRSLLPGGSWRQTAKTCKKYRDDDGNPIPENSPIPSGQPRLCVYDVNCSECRSLADKNDWDYLDSEIDFNNVDASILREQDVFMDDNKINVLLKNKKGDWVNYMDTPSEYPTHDNTYKNDDGQLKIEKKGIPQVLFSKWEDDINKKLEDWYKENLDQADEKLRKLAADKRREPGTSPGLYLTQLETQFKGPKEGFTIQISKLNAKETFQEIDFDLKMTGFKYFITHLIMPLYDSMVAPLLIKPDWKGILNLLMGNKVLLFIAILAFVGGVLVLASATGMISVTGLASAISTAVVTWIKTHIGFKIGASILTIIGTGVAGIVAGSFKRVWGDRENFSLIDNQGELTEAGMIILTSLLNHLTPGGDGVAGIYKQAQEKAAGYIVGLPTILKYLGYLDQDDENLFSGLHMHIWNLGNETYQTPIDNILCTKETAKNRKDKKDSDGDYWWKTMRVEIRNYDGIPSGVFTCLPALSGNKMTETLDCISALFPENQLDILKFVHFNWRDLFPNMDIGLKYEYKKNTRYFSFVRLSTKRIHYFPNTKELIKQGGTVLQISYTLFKFIYYFLNLQKIDVGVNGGDFPSKVVDFLSSLLKKMYNFFAIFSKMGASKIIPIIKWLLFSVLTQLTRSEYDVFYKKIGSDYFDYSSISIADVAQELLAYFVDKFIEYLPDMLKGDFSEITISPEQIKEYSSESAQQKAITDFLKKLKFFEGDVSVQQSGGKADLVDWSGGNGGPTSLAWEEALKKLPQEKDYVDTSSEQDLFEPILKIINKGVTWPRGEPLSQRPFFGQKTPERMYHKSQLESGNTYEGEWKDDKMDGHGIYTWKEGSKYEGGWKDNDRVGFGINTWAGGNTYEGAFKDDKLNGWGIYTRPDGSMYKRRMKEDELLVSEPIDYYDPKIVCRNCHDGFVDESSPLCRECAQYNYKYDD